MMKLLKVTPNIQQKTEFFEVFLRSTILNSLARLYFIYYYVLLFILFIPSHEYIFLIDLILYSCRSHWFRISMEIDSLTHCHVTIFIK
jgi:hypothetical protein